jgi:coenzyme F420-0:L-glutamate ligase/coenzyme F420-1:gamma-L-glutamate ligase
MAAAGVDASNTPDGTVLLLPEDPDASAEAIRSELLRRFGLNRLGVVITDTVGRPWRSGLVDIAIGAAGVAVVDDLRGQSDSHGRELNVTVTAVVDEIAAASELVRGKATGRAIAVVRGLERYVLAETTAQTVAVQTGGLLPTTHSGPEAPSHGAPTNVPPAFERWRGARSLVRPSEDDLFREGSAEAYARGFADGLARNA